LLLLALWLALLAVSTAERAPARVDLELLATLLDTVGITLALVAGAACLLHWRVSGEAPPFHIGVALLVYGTLTVGGGTVAPRLLDIGLEPSMALRAASRIAFIGLLVHALRTPAVDASLRAGRDLMLVLAAIAVLTGVFVIWPTAGAVIAGSAEFADEAAAPVTYSLLAVLWTLLAAAYVVSGMRHHRALLTWMGIALAGLTLIELTRLLLGPVLTVPGSSALRVGGLLAALVGAALDLRTAFVAQQGSLLDSALTARTAQARMRVGDAQDRRRAHDALNALTAIQGASATLERFQDRLPPAERTQLVKALGSEIARLQRLVAAPAEPDVADTYSLAGQLGTVIADARAEGALIEVEIPQELRAHGRWADTAEAFRAALAALRSHAPASPLLVTTADADEVVLLRAEHGPVEGGVTPQAQRPVEELPGGSLDLRVAADLVRNQGGDLLFEQRGADLAFVFRLPGSAPGETH
jgi:hypothetical protein